MKLKYIFTSLLLLILISCNSTSNSPEFIKKATGRYLYNSDEIIEVYFNESNLYLKWRGANTIEPLKIEEETFFVKEMNEKIQFLTNPSNNQDYIVLIPKEENDTIQYNFRKLNETEKIPSEYLLGNQFDKALEGYLAIKQKDSLNSAINENDLNSLGYEKLRNKSFEDAINIFKINMALHPESSNVFDSLGEAYAKSGDTLQAIENYEKSLSLDSGNRSAKRQLDKLNKVHK